MPDILNTEKSEIREKAKAFAKSLWKVPFNKGFIVYTQTSNELFIHPARWRYCIKCGQILKSNLSKKNDTIDEAMNHSCILEHEDIPLLIRTSWIKLRKFFLIDKKYEDILQQIGLPDLPKTVKQEKTSLQKEAASDKIAGKAQN